MLRVLMVASFAVKVRTECLGGSCDTSAVEQEAYYGDGFIHKTCSRIGCDGEEFVRLRHKLGEEFVRLWHKADVAERSLKLKAQMYEYALKASAHMHAYGESSSVLLAWGATQARTFIERFLPSFVAFTPKSDVGLFLTIVSMLLLIYPIYKLVQLAARVTISLCCCCCRKSHPAPAKGNDLSSRNIEPRPITAKDSRSRTRASTPPPPVQKISEKNDNLSAGSWRSRPPASASARGKALAAAMGLSEE